jgi:hypothetical protein
MNRSPEALIAFSKQLAEASAEIIRRYFRADYAVEFKADASRVPRTWHFGRRI